jgi:hypothetical protein
MAVILRRPGQEGEGDITALRDAPIGPVPAEVRGAEGPSDRQPSWG